MDVPSFMCTPMTLEYLDWRKLCRSRIYTKLAQICVQ